MWRSAFCKKRLDLRMAPLSVYTRLHGGLGNQLFQYAAGFALAKRLRTDLIIDARIFDNSSLRKYELGHFNISARLGDKNDLPPSKQSPLRYLVWRYGKQSPIIYRENNLRFNPTFCSIEKPVYLHGYWQSERYFLEFGEELRTELSFTSPPFGKNAELFSEISAKNCVSLHVRRGDYISSAGSKAHGVCSAEYFTNAINEISCAIGEQFTIVIFSDEPQWARENLKSIQPSIIVDINDSSKGFEDMRLMAACSHHIIANSSFSWWGAWLNSSKQKIVVAPKQWFANPTLRNPDLLPKNWIPI
jgi:Glycosyl transferase family 11